MLRHKAKEEAGEGEGGLTVRGTLNSACSGDQIQFSTSFHLSVRMRRDVDKVDEGDEKVKGKNKEEKHGAAPPRHALPAKGHSLCKQGVPLPAGRCRLLRGHFPPILSTFSLSARRNHLGPEVTHTRACLSLAGVLRRRFRYFILTTG